MNDIEYASHTPIWQRIFPWLLWSGRVNPQNLRFDFVAGLTGAIILVPQGIAFATIAGMPPQYGLYAAMIPAVVAALWGSSWHLVSGPTTAISIVVFASISPLAEPGSAEFVRLVLTLTFMVAVIQLLMGVMRLGSLINFVSHTVVIGFTMGAALLIVTSQIQNFFDIPVPRGLSFTETLMLFMRQVGHINPYVTAVSVTTVLVCALVRYWRPQWPYMIVGMVGGSLLGVGMNSAWDENKTGIHFIGELGVGFPPFSAPDFNFDTLRLLAPIALAVAMLALTEAVSIARAIGQKSGQRIDGNQEFIGQGLSNLAGAFFSGYASSGSFNRTGLNYLSGAKTPLAAVFSALLLLFIVQFLNVLAAYIAIPAMAGILFVVAWGLIDVRQVRHILFTSGRESMVMLATLAATLTLQLEIAIYIGVAFSVLLYLRSAARPSVDAVSSAEYATVQVNGAIFFGAIEHLQGCFTRLLQQAGSKPKMVVRANGVHYIDLAGAEWLENTVRQFREQGIDLYFQGFGREPLRTLQKYGVAHRIGLDHFIE